MMFFDLTSLYTLQKLAVYSYRMKPHEEFMGSLGDLPLALRNEIICDTRVDDRSGGQGEANDDPFMRFNLTLHLGEGKELQLCITKHIDGSVHFSIEIDMYMNFYISLEECSIFRFVIPRDMAINLFTHTILSLRGVPSTSPIMKMLEVEDGTEEMLYSFFKQISKFNTEYAKIEKYLTPYHRELINVWFDEVENI